MEVLYKRCCGIDIHKNMMVACIFTSVRKKEIRQFSTITEDILQLVSWLKETDCDRSLYTLFISYPASWIITIIMQVTCFWFVRRKVHRQLLGENAE